MVRGVEPCQIVCGAVAVFMILVVALMQFVAHMS